MKKEFLKTAVLTLLVISSLVLSVNIWYEKELWSMDYSSFVYSLKNLFQKEDSGKFTNTDELMYWSEFSPEFISFTYGSQKKIVYDSSPEFEGALQKLVQTVDSLEKEGEIVSVTDEEYLNTYKTNSMMLKFPREISVLSFLKQEDGFLDAVKEPLATTVVIGIDESQTNYLSFRDTKTGHAYRMPVKSKAPGKKIAEEIASYGQNDSFAFELNFDTKTDDSERILFQRFVPITLEETQLQSLRVQPVYYSSEYDGVFKAFGIVKNSARTYKDKEGNVHFIENRSTLKISPQGAFRFEVTDSEAGVSLKNRDEKEAVLEFVNLLYQNIVPESDAFLTLYRVETTPEKKVYQFLYNARNGSLYIEGRPAVSVTVKNGTVVEYDQQVLSVMATDNTETTTGVLEAYDSLYNREDFSQKSKLTVRSMIPCHIYRDGELFAGWVCRFSDQSLTYFIK